MARPARPLTPFTSPRHFLGAELRWWREHRHLSLADLQRKVHFSEALLTKVEKAERGPSAALITACDTALDAGGALTRLLAFVESYDPAPPTTLMIRLNPNGAASIRVADDR